MTAELSKDIAELENIRKSALRGNVQTFLDETIKQWRLKLDSLEATKPAETVVPQAKNNVIKTPATAIRPLKKLTTYAFDESDKFVKLYYSVPGISSCPADKVLSHFTESFFSVRCTDVNGIDYELEVKGFASPVNADKSTVKIKSDDNLLVMLKKKTEGQTWGSLLKLNKTKDTKMPDMDASGDPGDSLMNMMKKMYDEGDDEMKRTIRKAWHESQTKKTTADGLPDF